MSLSGCIDRTNIAGPQRADAAKPRILKPGVMITDSTFAVGCFNVPPWLRGDRALVERARADNRVAERLLGQLCPDVAAFDTLARQARPAQPK